MIHPSLPWSALGNQLLDSNGTVIAIFTDFKALDYVVACVRNRELISTHHQTTSDLINELTEHLATFPE